MIQIRKTGSADNTMVKRKRKNNDLQNTTQNTTQKTKELES
jgi:hypothetical protein